MARVAMTQDKYDKMLESFRIYPGNLQRAADYAGVKWETAKRFYNGPAPGGHALPNGWRPIREVLADEGAARAKAREDQEAALAKERERLSKEAEDARRMEEEAKAVDAASLRALRKTTLGGLASLAALTDGITLLARRVGTLLQTGTDAQGKPLDIKPSEALRILQAYSLTVGRLGSVVDTLQAMERVKQGLPTAIMGIDVAHVTLEDAEREVEFAKGALARAKELGLIVVEGGAAVDAEVLPLAPKRSK